MLSELIKRHVACGVPICLFIVSISSEAPLIYVVSSSFSKERYKQHKNKYKMKKEGDRGNVWWEDDENGMLNVSILSSLSTVVVESKGAIVERNGLTWPSMLLYDENLKRTWAVMLHPIQKPIHKIIWIIKTLPSHNNVKLINHLKDAVI